VQPTSAATASPTPAGPVETVVETVATGLDTPWDLEFAPDGRLFVTERPGRVRVIENGELVEQPVLTVDIATNTAEGGLLGIAVDPNFERNGYIYVMYTYDGADDASPNRISRFKLREDRALEEQVLVSDIPGAAIHDGGRLSFGPDGKLYATTGDAAATENAQSLESLSGKILRMNPDGSVPDDNPFPDSLVYSLGHRNPQGLAWRPGDEELFSTEHGARGNDEVNRIHAGENYGWPLVEGDEHSGEYRAPLAFYNPSIAPSGATFYNNDAIPQWRGSFFFTTLRGEHLHRLVLDDEYQVAEQERLFEGEYGRLRAVEAGPDSALYFATSNRDGRGDPSEEDDRILRVIPRP